MSAWGKAWGAAWGNAWGRHASQQARAGYGYIHEPIRKKETDDDEVMMFVICALHALSGTK